MGENADVQTLVVDDDTGETSMPGVFAAGDVVTGPNTIVDAVAAGKRFGERTALHPLDLEVRRGEVVLPPDPVTEGLYLAVVEHLDRRGFPQYEVSNFASSDPAGGSTNRSRHNRKYWTFAPYLGFGPGAHSYLEPQRYWNHRNLQIYLTDIPSFTLMYRPQNFHAVNETVWTNFPFDGDGSDPPIPPLNCTDGWSIACLYNLETVE